MESIPIIRAVRAGFAPHNKGVDSSCTSISFGHMSLYLPSADMVDLRIASVRLFWILIPIWCSNLPSRPLSMH